MYVLPTVPHTVPTFHVRTTYCPTYSPYISCTYYLLSHIQSLHFMYVLPTVPHTVPTFHVRTTYCPTYSPYNSPTQGICVYRMIRTAKPDCFTNINRLVFVDKPEFDLYVTKGIFTHYLHEFQYSRPYHG